MSAAVTLELERRPSAPVSMLRAILPADRPRGIVPAITARWSGHRVDRSALAAFLRIAELPAGPSLPLLYPHVFGFRLPMAVLTHPAFPVPIWGVLQTRNHLLRHHPIALDASTSRPASRAAPRYGSTRAPRRRSPPSRSTSSRVPRSSAASARSRPAPTITARRSRPEGRAPAGAYATRVPRTIRGASRRQRRKRA